MTNHNAYIFINKETLDIDGYLNVIHEDPDDLGTMTTKLAIKGSPFEQQQHTKILGKWVHMFAGAYKSYKAVYEEDFEGVTVATGTVQRLKANGETSTGAVHKSMTAVASMICAFDDEKIVVQIHFKGGAVKQCSGTRVSHSDTQDSSSARMDMYQVDIDMSGSFTKPEMTFKRSKKVLVKAHNASTTNDQAHEILLCMKQKMKQIEISEKFDVSVHALSRMKKKFKSEGLL
ncbi:TPA: helix-turn-helix domain-containing protein [Aeromonas hydrophila subsp. hydrophila]|nr:helix-turn-helix domain-containing protein [Aeromonas hydrophila subsp. hydrophila]